MVVERCASKAAVKKKKRSKGGCQFGRMGEGCGAGGGVDEEEEGGQMGDADAGAAGVGRMVNHEDFSVTLLAMMGADRMAVLK